MKSPWLWRRSSACEDPKRLSISGSSTNATKASLVRDGVGKTTALAEARIAGQGWHTDRDASKNDPLTEAPCFSLTLSRTAPSHQLHRKTSRIVLAQARILRFFVLSIMDKRTCSDTETSDESAHKDVQLEHEDAQPWWGELQTNSCGAL